jgi:voltage-gated potassium channel
MFPPPPGCRRVWVPFRGFIDVDDEIRERVNRLFNVPMLTLAILVLPVLVVDYYVSKAGRQHEALAWGVLVAHITISAAFLVEFAVKIRIAQSRLRYIATNWVDVIIIILPFLRPLRVLRAFRVLELSRVYAVRGVGVKAVRTFIPVVLGLRFVQRFRPSQPEAVRTDYARWPRSALLAEVRRLAERVEELEASPGDGQGDVNRPTNPCAGTCDGG